MQPRGAIQSFLLDGVLLTAATHDARPADRFALHAPTPRFEVVRTPGTKGVGLRSEAIPGTRIAMHSDDERPVPPAPYRDCTITSVYHSDLSGDIQRKLMNDSLVNWDAHNVVISGDGANHFAGYNLAPLVVPARSQRQVYLAIACSQGDDPRATAERVYAGRLALEDRAREQYARQRYALRDTPFTFSQKLAMTQLCTNVTYPNYIEDGYYVAHTPAKRWGDITFWDSGMHGLGLLEYSVEAAALLLNQFMVRETHPDVIVVTRGRIFPVHIHLLNEIYQRTHDLDLLSHFYPRARRYHHFMLGKEWNPEQGEHRFRILESHDTGAAGIDDYPAKWFLESADSTRQANSPNALAHAVRSAKILRMLARQLGLAEQVEEFSAEIEILGAAIETRYWDETSGYYSYIYLDDGEKLLYDDGTNYNMGLDGVSPLVAATSTRERRQRLIAHLMTPGELWTDHGITAVAMNAPYSRRDGYWNGKVWMPYQWFMWKALIGEAELEHAERIALTAIGVWKDAADETYNSYELFDSTTGMGQGAHQFAGLSGPVAALYNAYYTPGRITAGYDTMIDSSAFDPARNRCRCTVSAPYRPGPTALVLAMNEPGAYEVDIDGRVATVTPQVPWLGLTLELDDNPTQIEVRPAG